MLSKIIGVRDVMAITGLSRKQAYSAPIRQRVDGAREAVFTKKQAEDYAKAERPRRAQASKFVGGNTPVTPNSPFEDGYCFGE